MDSSDLMSSEHFHVILHPDKKHSLIFNRLDNNISTINYDDARELSNLKKVARIYGVVGKFLSKYLVLIKNRALVGSLYEPSTKTEHKVYVITQVQVIDLTCSSSSKDQRNQQQTTSSTVRYETENFKKTTCDLETVQESNTVDDFSSLPITISTSSHSRAGPWNPFKLANNLRPRLSAHPSRVATGHQNGNGASSNQTCESDRRLVDEMMKLFNNTNSFYYSPTLDLTNRFSRKPSVRNSGNEALWKTADERFFWNKHMLRDLIELSNQDNDANYFICVILQGFIAIEHHTVSIYQRLTSPGVEPGLLATTTNAAPTSAFTNSNSNDCDSNPEKNILENRRSSKNYHLAIISRRSVLQAGTRYLRRGVDEKGSCANFVETEQIFRYNQHFTSIVIIRGSIPLFWYQSGLNYRPPPIISKGEEENYEAFSKHFQGLVEAYKTERIIVIDCTEQCGREKNLHDAYKRNLQRLQKVRPPVRLIEFDFHKHCRGRQCSDAQVEKHLKLCGLDEDLLKSTRYYWNDGDVICNQEALFRVNCIDCSDRTNVVQRAIALQVLDIQLARLGIVAPDTCPQDNECRRIMQNLWSTNGNVLSTQYCGTKALFTEDRKLSGYLKDTYSSASRYYIGKFRDAYRQAAIDAMLGVDTPESVFKAAGVRDPSNPSDNYDLIGLDPLLAGKGGALLKDVGNRVSNRIARLTGKFHVRPFGLDSISRSERTGDDIEDPDLIEAQDTLDELNIDWPSSESIDNTNNRYLFNEISNNEDNFQDDEFGQLTLSADLTDLQRKQDGDPGGQSTDPCKVEEIHLTEACGLNGTGETKTVTTSTTST